MKAIPSTRHSTDVQAFLALSARGEECSDHPVTIVAHVFDVRAVVFGSMKAGITCQLCECVQDNGVVWRLFLSQAIYPLLRKEWSQVLARRMSFRCSFALTRVLDGGPHGEPVHQAVGLACEAEILHWLPFNFN